MTLTLQANYRVPAQIAVTVRAVLEPGTATPVGTGDAVRLHRAATLADEAAFVAQRIAALRAAGTPAGRIAVVHRSLRTLGVFEDALVDRDIPIALHGDGALFARHDTLDALALLWCTVDAFAHGWLLRVLQLPLVNVSDATLAILCGEPTNPQAALFELPVEESDGTRRWDRRRDVRLGTNVVRGDRDADLDAEACRRLVAFRERRARWQQFARHADVAAAARAIVTDGGIFEQRAGETAARARRRADVVDAMLDVIARATRRDRFATLRDALISCERIARAQTGPLLDSPATDSVVVAAIDQVKTRRFDEVFVVDVRAGSFPPYYVPDAFLFSLTYGMIPKDSVGDAISARTAKFTWYMHHAKLRESYARESRQALAVALARADVRVTVSASGNATRGVGAPELLVELAARGLPPSPADQLADTASTRDAAPAPAAPPPARVAAPPTPARRAIAVERLGEMMRCVICAPRRTIATMLDASFTLGPGRATAADKRIAERDVTFAFPIGDAVIYGSVTAIIVHAQRRYALVSQPDENVAALVLHGLGQRVADDAFFVETADGLVRGPIAVAVDVAVAAAGEIITGERAPRCAEHRIPD